MLVEGGGWVEGEVDQFEAPVQMLVVVVGGVGRGRGPSIESTSTNVGGGRRVVRGRGPSIESTSTNVGGGRRVVRGRGPSI